MPLPDRLSSLSAKDDINKNRESTGDVGTTPETTENQMIQRCVIVQRDDKGYGLTVSGDNPVFVQSVKSEGAAARCGVQEGDKILKVNGTLVTNRNHIDVVKLIKSGPLVALTLLGKPPPNTLDKSATIITPQHLSSSSNRVTAPQPVDPEKDKELWHQKVHTTRAMYEQARDDYEKSKRNYVKSPSEKLNTQLQEKDRTVKRLEEQLKNITGSTDISPSTPISSMSDTDKSPMDQNSNTSWRNKYVRHSKQASVPVNMYLAESQESRTSTSVSRSKSDVASRRQATYVSYIGGMGSNSLAQQPSSIVTKRRMLKRTSSLPSSVPTISDAGSLSDSPPTSPSISPTPSHPSNRIDDSSSSSRVDSGIEDSSGISTQNNIITIDDEDINSEEEMPDGKSWAPNQRPVSPFLHKLQKSETGDAGPFSDITALEKKPAHLGIFLHYLISNSDPSPVFFYIISDMYSHAQGNSKDIRKWAYEIYSTFLAANAPLSAGLEETVTSPIKMSLSANSKTTSDSQLRTVFEPARVAVRGIIQDLLADFRQKKDLGLGSIYGTHELRDDMDKQTETKMIEKYLMTHLSVLVGEDKLDRDQAMGWALATFLRQTIPSKSQNAGMMERVQSFVMKDKRSLRFPITKSKSKTVKGHQFTLQHYYMVTFCAHCNSLIWGIGYQGYQCNSCEINVHRQCVDDLVDNCSGKQKKREKRASAMIPVIPSIRKFSNPNPSAGSSFTTVNEALREATNLAGDGKGKDILTQPVKRDEEAEFAGYPAGHSVKSIIDRYEKPSPDDPVGSEEEEETKDSKNSKKKKDIGRSESMKSRGDKKDRDSKKRSKSDVDVDDSTIKALNQSGSSSTSSLGVDSHIESMDEVTPDEQTDSDLDVESDLPTLKSVVGEERLRKLKPKEKKRQEVLNELIHTEKTHVRNLKILDKLFFRPMAAETQTSDLAKQLLPNIHQMIRLHSAFNNGLKARRKENPVIDEVGDLFLKRFNGDEGIMFKNGCSTFCQGQSFALDALKKQQRKEQRLSQFLNDAESNPLCRRLQLKDLVPTQFQRLTKYPLLIENLLKYTLTNTEEYRKLQLAHQKTKEILAGVNQSVKDFENSYRLKILQKKMEKKIPGDSQESKRRQINEDMKNLDLSQHKLVYEGELTWRLRPNRLIELHVILLEDILVLLQKQDDKLILKCQSLNVHNADPLRGELGRNSDAGKGYTHSPILKLQNLLSRNVATDKKAFFVINTSEAGPQIYELIASTQDRRKKWHSYINTWADTCKSSKKGQKSTVTPAKTSTEITTPQPEEITEIRDRITVRPPENLPPNLSRAETNTNDATQHRESSELMETAKVRTEPELVRPADIKVSNLVVAHSKPVTTPLEQLKRNDEKLVELLYEKESLVMTLTNLTRDECRILTEPSDFEDQDSRYLLAAGIQRMDDLTNLITAGCQSLVNQPKDSTHSNTGPGVNIPLPMSKLREMAAEMNSILTKLLSAVGNSDEERDRLRIELKAAQDQLNVLREIKRTTMAAEQSSQSRPASMVSIASSELDEMPDRDQYMEDEDDTPQESDEEMIVVQHTELMEMEPHDSDHELEALPEPEPDYDLDSKEDEEEVSNVEFEDAIDQLVSENVQHLNNSNVSQEKTNLDKSDHITCDQPIDSVTDNHVINHVIEVENESEVVVDNVTVGESSDFHSDTILNQAESLETSTHSESVEVVMTSSGNSDNVEDAETSNPSQDNLTTTSTNSEHPLLHSNIDSIEGANYSDSDSTLTPYFSEMDSEVDPMAKSDATLVGSINSILSESDTTQEPSPISCDASCDSQRTNEPVQSDQSNKADGIEL